MHATIRTTALQGIVYAHDDAGVFIVEGLLSFVLTFCQKWGYTTFTQGK